MVVLLVAEELVLLEVGNGGAFEGVGLERDGDEGGEGGVVEVGDDLLGEALVEELADDLELDGAGDELEENEAEAVDVELLGPGLPEGDAGPLEFRVLLLVVLGDLGEAELADFEVSGVRVDVDGLAREHAVQLVEFVQEVKPRQNLQAPLLYHHNPRLPNLLYVLPNRARRYQLRDHREVPLSYLGVDYSQDKAVLQPPRLLQHPTQQLHLLLRQVVDVVDAPRHLAPRLVVVRLVNRPVLALGDLRLTSNKPSI